MVKNMGTINYFTSDYITMGINPLSSYELKKDDAFMEEMKEDVKEHGGTIEQAIDDYIMRTYEDDKANIESILKEYDLHYYHIVIKPGYYEGFSLDIENNFGLCYDSYIDKKEAQKEITQIKKMLIECAGCGLVEVSPGWCTGYSDYEGTLKAINEAIKEMRDECSTIPTWNTYRKSEWR